MKDHSQCDTRIFGPNGYYDHPLLQVRCRTKDGETFEPLRLEYQNEWTQNLVIGHHWDETFRLNNISISLVDPSTGLELPLIPDPERYPLPFHLEKCPMDGTPIKPTDESYKRYIPCSSCQREWYADKDGAIQAQRAVRLTQPLEVGAKLDDCISPA